MLVEIEREIAEKILFKLAEVRDEDLCLGIKMQSDEVRECINHLASALSR